MGRVFDIQHFSTHDGPGIRTTVFLKGCPLHCSWCHNPESQSVLPEVMYHRQRCIGCMSCGGNHHGDPEVCPTGAMELCGREMSVDEVMSEVLKDESYYRHSDGGITLSGGEPLFQPAFSKALLEYSHSRGIHTAVETSGCCPLESCREILPVTDLFIWDIKLMDPQLYRKHTGGSLSDMLSNLEYVSGVASGLLLRVLFIPEIHLAPAIVQATRDLLKRVPHSGVEVIPYHLFGNAKREKLGLPEVIFREPTADEIRLFTEEILASGSL